MRVMTEQVVMTAVGDDRAGGDDRAVEIMTEQEGYERAGGR